MEYFNEHLIGFIILGLSVVLSGGMLLLGWFLWKKRQPTIWYRGVGIRYKKGATPDWQGLEAQIDALWAIAERDHPEDSDDLMDFWIDVVSLEGKVTGFMAPRGRKLNGTVDKSSLYGLFHKTYVMVVRQLMPAHASALAHEVIEHFWSFQFYKDWGQDADREGGPITPRGKELLALKHEARKIAKENTK